MQWAEAHGQKPDQWAFHKPSIYESGKYHGEYDELRIP